MEAGQEGCQLGESWQWLELGLAASRLTSPTAFEVGNGSGESRDWQVLRSASLTLCVGVSVLPHPLWHGPGMLSRAAVAGRGNGLP